jgi:uncharacterized protein (TIGR04255 family)
MTTLPNPPLIYALGIVRFPAVPSMEKFVPNFHEAIRREYPHSFKIELQQAQLEIGPNGVRINQSTSPLWQFASPNRKLAVVLSSDAMALHTNAYHDHETFILSFKSALEKFLAVPELGVEWLNFVAMRYVNLVAANQARLDEILKPSVLPALLDNELGLEATDGVYLTQYKTAEGDVRFQIFRNPPTVFPQDLDTPLIASNEWGIERPARDFVIIDTDCQITFKEPQRLAADIAVSHMLKLRGVAKRVFDAIGTERASQLWAGEA